MPTQIFPLSEGEFTVGRDKQFQPFILDKDELTDRTRGSLLVEVQPFAIVNDDDVLLLDTGLGFNHPDGKNVLIDNLAKHHIHAEDVTKILMSHLHKDHAGGLDIDAFPHAKIYIYRPEYEYALSVGKPSYFTDEWLALATSERVVWLDLPQGNIDTYIQYEHSGAHCPEHIVFKIHTENGIIFYGGDEAPQHKQMKMKYIAKYDYDGKKAMELRAAWAAQGADEGWTFLYYHDIKTPMAIL